MAGMVAGLVGALESLGGEVERAGLCRSVWAAATGAGAGAVGGVGSGGEQGLVHVVLSKAWLMQARGLLQRDVEEERGRQAGGGGRGDFYLLVKSVAYYKSKGDGQVLSSLLDRAQGEAGGMQEEKAM